MNGTLHRAVIDQEFQNISGEFTAGGARVPLQYGVVKGDLVSFETRARDADGQTQAMLFEGALDGDTIEATVYIGGRERNVTARRVQ